LIDREKKIAEIREALRRVEFGTYRITAFADLEYWLRFLLSELDRAEKELELFDQRGETIERQFNIIEQLQEENRKLREKRDKLIEGLRSIRNELDHLSRESRQKWKHEGDMYEQGRADAYDEADVLIRDILKECGVTKDA